MGPQTKECQEPQEAGKDQEGLSPGVCRGSVALLTPPLGLLAPRTVRE